MNVLARKCPVHLPEEFGGQNRMCRPHIAKSAGFGHIGAADYALFGSESFSTVFEISAASW
eukprot:scaffold127058_cov33-Phaeocystis_antarctica.AAC.1